MTKTIPTFTKILKIKAFIYRLTGIYLAHKEELEYITSRETWALMIKSFNNKGNDMSLRNIQSLYIGMWQANHGFVRPAKRRYRK